MIHHAPGRATAILLGIVVSFIWASSVVLVRLGLSEEVTDPIGFAGVRFTLAAILLLPLAWSGLRASAADWNGLRGVLPVVPYGLLMFGIAQIAIHVSLDTVSASTMGLMIGLTPVMTALLVLRAEGERPGPVQLVGVAVLVVGIAIYFGPELPEPESTLGLALAVLVPVATGAAVVLGRRLALDVARYGGPLGLTAMAMVTGGILALVVGLALEGLPSLSLQGWLLVAWMAVVNTALAYTLWTQIQRTLLAVESSVLGDVTVLLTAVLGWLVLGEVLGTVEVAGLVIAVMGVAVVQLAPLVRARETA